MINADLLKILACPACKTGLAEKNNSLHCANPQCGLIYPVRDGIPVLLIEEAQKPAQ